MIFALVAHAGANVINDYYDAVSGCDAANDERLFPFTGGSRFIENGVLTAHEVKVFGYGLLFAVIPPGLWLAAHSAPGLLVIGAAGLAAGWAYSAPPLKLQARGVGEFAITAAWALLRLCGFEGGAGGVDRLRGERVPRSRRCLHQRQHAAGAH